METVSHGAEQSGPDCGRIDMERLTGYDYIAGVKTGDLLLGVNPQKAFDRLAAYEDTGLEPGEIEAVARLASENCAKTAAAIDRLLADEKIVKTRGDRVRAMPDEELARQFGAQCPKKVKRVCDERCHLCWLEWLRQPAEEGD